LSNTEKHGDSNEYFIRVSQYNFARSCEFQWWNLGIVFKRLGVESGLAREGMDFVVGSFIIRL
jgi:hypothetical protein